MVSIKAEWTWNHRALCQTMAFNLGKWEVRLCDRLRDNNKISYLRVRQQVPFLFEELDSYSKQSQSQWLGTINNPYRKTGTVVRLCKPQPKSLNFIRSLVPEGELKYKSVNKKKSTSLAKSWWQGGWEKGGRVRKRLKLARFGVAWVCEINCQVHPLSNAPSINVIPLKIKDGGWCLKSLSEWKISNT